MSVLSGYNKYKRYILTSSGYKLCSHWTSSNTVHFDDGKTAQTKVGAISGITDSLTSTSSNVALSAKSGKSLQDQVTTLNTGLNWKNLGHLSKSGSYAQNYLVLPQGYRELLIYSTATSSQGMIVHVPAGVSDWACGSYYITPTDNAFYRVGLQNNRIWLGVAYKNGGTDVTDATQLDVYYKL